MELKSKGQDLKLGDKFIPYVEEGELIAPTKNKNFSFCGSESPEHCPPRHFTSKAPLSFLRKKVKKKSKALFLPTNAINSTKENLCS